MRLCLTYCTSPLLAARPWKELCMNILAPQAHQRVYDFVISFFIFLFFLLVSVCNGSLNEGFINVR